MADLYGEEISIKTFQKGLIRTMCPNSGTLVISISKPESHEIAFEVDEISLLRIADGRVLKWEREQKGDGESSTIIYLRVYYTWKRELEYGESFNSDLEMTMETVYSLFDKE
jgi:hypothetical protein